MTIDTTILVDWFATHGRKLPWREPDCTPWGVLVSEIMLQQTPVTRVEPIWQEWMARWPVPSALAGTSPGEVVRAWGKLGYPRRALRLHATAVVLATEHNDVVPSDVDTLLALPGIGAYTARAIAVFAYGARAPVVDTNVRRVVARAVHGAGDAGPPANAKDMADVEAILPQPAHQAARFSVAVMELGATTCTARAPQCHSCPISARCAWLRAGRPAYAGPPKPVQRFAGTDRQVRGLLLDVLREATTAVPKIALDVVWMDGAQRERCLNSLLDDGLVEQISEDQFALPGEHPAISTKP